MKFRQIPMSSVMGFNLDPIIDHFLMPISSPYNTRGFFIVCLFILISVFKFYELHIFIWFLYPALTCASTLRSFNQCLQFCFDGAEYWWTYMRADSEGLDEIRRLSEAGKLKMPVEKTFPITQVREAHMAKDKRHVPGKIVLELDWRICHDFYFLFCMTGILRPKCHHIEVPFWSVDTAL